MSRFAVNYEHPELGSTTDPAPKRWGMAQIETGFWVGRFGVIHADGRGPYWIPPAKINFVKVEHDDRSE